MGCLESKPVAPLVLIPRLHSQYLKHTERFEEEEKFLLKRLSRFDFNFLSNELVMQINHFTMNFYINNLHFVIPLKDKLSSFQNAGYTTPMTTNELIDSSIMVKNTQNGDTHFFNIKDCVEFKRNNQYYTLQYLNEEKQFVIIPYCLYDKKFEQNAPVEFWNQFPDFPKCSISNETLMTPRMSPSPPSSFRFPYSKKISDFTFSVAGTPQMELCKFRYDENILMDQMKNYIKLNQNFNVTSV